MGARRIVDGAGPGRRKVMRTRSHDFGNQDSPAEPLAFPQDPSGHAQAERRPPLDLTALPESAGGVFDAIEDMSRRIDHLARELGCLGFFDEDDDGPRAA
jgi:hypothetical protein